MNTGTLQIVVKQYSFVTKEKEINEPDRTFTVTDKDTLKIELITKLTFQGEELTKFLKQQHKKRTIVGHIEVYAEKV
jgi:hypothetical protein